MLDVGFDFTDRQVVVTGGTGGTGLAIAHAFRAAGARVSVTGTKILPTLYDTDLAAFDYHQLQLTSSDAIDSFVERVGRVDVLVNAAGARLPGAVDEHEREFLVHSARLGFVGPQRLTQQLRPRLCASTVPGGGAVVHTSRVLAWYELALPPADAEAELRSHTTRAGRAWARLGARVNTVLSPARTPVPRQGRPPGASTAAAQGPGTLLTRHRTGASVSDATSPVALFLASQASAGLSGNTLVVAPPR